MIQLNLHVEASCVSLFFSLLEKGVILQAKTGCTLRDFLCGQLGFSSDYIDQRVQTLFLDARPVDNVDAAMVKNGSTLALSAAMPGLLGATMRKGGRYAAFRKDISQHTDNCGICNETGQVTVKLFNMVAQEVGGHLLEKGIEIEGSDLKRIADRYTEEICRSIRQVRIDDREVTPDKTLFSTLSKNRVWFSITIIT